MVRLLKFKSIFAGESWSESSSGQRFVMRRHCCPSESGAKKRSEDHISAWEARVVPLGMGSEVEGGVGSMPGLVVVVVASAPVPGSF